MRIFLICPVRFASEEQTRAIADWVRYQENVEGNVVHWPARDTLQTQTSFKICEDNRFAMQHSDEVHVWYEPTSQGSVFDIGMAFVMGKPVFLVNPDAVQPTDSKSYNNLVIDLDQRAREWKQHMENLMQPYHVRYPDGHSMRSASDMYGYKEPKDVTFPDIPVAPFESEIEDELKGMPYDETPGQDAAAMPNEEDYVFWSSRRTQLKEL